MDKAIANFKKDIRLRYSSIKCYLDCKRKFYWGFVRNLESKSFKHQFLLGSVVHFGLNEILGKVKSKVSVEKFFDNYILKVKNDISLSPEQEQKSEEQRVLAMAILKSYTKHYKSFIKEVKLIHSEQRMFFDLDKGVKLSIKPDNILKRGGKFFLHELKTTKQLNADYVRNIKSDLQTSIYFHKYNESKKGKEKLSGIIYDVIGKPSIRLKKTESYPQFLNRLEAEYTNFQTDYFYMDESKCTLLDKHRIDNLIEKISTELLSYNEIDDYYPNDRFCFIKYRCDYYDLCHYGENAMNMMRFRERKNQEEEDDNEIAERKN